MRSVLRKAKLNIQGGHPLRDPGPVGQKRGACADAGHREGGWTRPLHFWENERSRVPS